MNIIIDPVEVKISGNVELDIFDQNRNTKQHQEFSNSIHDELLDAIASAMQANSNTAFYIHTGSGWFNANRPVGDLQDDRHGIIITQKTNTSAGKTYAGGSDESYDLCLSDNKSTTYGNSNSVTWQAETTWTGPNGANSASSGNFDKMQMGYDYKFVDQSSMNSQAKLLHDHFEGTVFATANHSSDFTQFVLDDNDIARVTWTITIS
jgi:hypothetical protein